MRSSRPAATRAATGSRPDPATTAPGAATDDVAPPTDSAVVWRLSGAQRFAALRRTRYRARSGSLRVAWVPGPAGSPPCVGYAIGKRVGPAVVRNRLRRRLRAAVAPLRLPPGDYLVVCDPAAASLPFSDLKVLVSTAMSSLSPTAT